MNLSKSEEFKYKFGFPIAVFGECITHPTKLAINEFAKAVRKFNPGSSGQWATKAKEIAHRVIICFTLLLSLPYHLTLGLLGLGIHVITTPLRKKVTLISNNQGEIPEQLRVCTFNTALLPDAVNIIKPCVPESNIQPIDGSLHERVNAIATAILKCDAHVVCLQEVFDPRAARLLRKILSRRYPNIAYNVGPKPLRLNSGLMTISKLPILNAGFRQFSNRIGIDSLAGKGFLAVTVKLGNKELKVLNTHMNSDVALSGGWRTDVRPIREKQLKSIFDSARQNPNHVICGDFNTFYYRSDEYEVASDIGGIDYILAQKGELISHEISSMDDSSDHSAVIANLRVSP